MLLAGILIAFLSCLQCVVGAITMSAFWTETVIAREEGLIELAGLFLKECWTPKDPSPVLAEFRKFLLETNRTQTAWQPASPVQASATSDTESQLFELAHHPVHVYVILKRLFDQWPDHLRSIRTHVACSQASANFRLIMKDFTDEGDGTVAHASIGQPDLDRSRLAIQTSTVLYASTPGPKAFHLTEIDMTSIPELRKGPEHDPYADTTEALCSGITKNKTSNHRCIYEERFVPYLRCKVEILNEDPDIKLYHDIFTVTQRMTILKEASSLLKESKLHVKGSHVGKTDPNTRASASAWLSPKRYQSVNELYKNVQLWSGLDTGVYTEQSAAERFQVVNYGVGGRFVAHHDYYDEARLGKRVDAPFLRGSGARLSTWMFYLTEPEIGGATVFTELGLHVVPRVGSALVWDNLRSDGDYETLTKHAGCPVAVGQKWIGNIWIRANAQIFRRPCPSNFRR